MTDRRVIVRGALLSLAALAAGCGVSPVADSAGRYADPIGTAPVIDNATPYTASLACLSAEIAAMDAGDPPRFAVGEIGDYTGKVSDLGGAKITQGAALMAVSALAKLGLPLVERLDMRIAQQELKLANNNLVSDAGAVRLIQPGSIPGSDAYLIGGITELNYNLRSLSAEAFYDAGGVGARLFVMNVAIDLRLVETATLQVADVVSYQKQILGREVRAGVFEFFGSTLFDVSVEERALEPMQLAVRAMIERAVGDMARRRFGLAPAICAPSPASEAPSSHSIPMESLS
ncbi:MAG: CsgG/HfaB family protein [Pseudomonadota bacterium]